MSFTSSGAAAHLPSLSVDVTAFGAKANGTADDSPAFRSAIAAVRNAGGGRVIIPTCKSPGARYRLDKDASAPASINIENSTAPIVLEFEAGARCLMEGAGNGGAWSLLCVRATQNLTIIGPDFEMGQIDNQDPDLGADPHHLIHLDNRGTPARDIANIKIIGGRFRYTRGDHIRLWSENGRLTREVWIENCYFDGADITTGITPPTVGARSCIQGQRNTKNIYVVNCYMTRANKAEIDLEPTGTGPVRNWKFLGNTIDHAPPDDLQAASAVAISGNGPTEPNYDTEFAGNIIYNGGIQTEQLDRCFIHHNWIYDDRPDVNPSLHLNGRISDCVVEHNFIRRGAGNTSAYQPVVLVQHGGGATDVPSGLRFENNDLVQAKYSSVVHIEGHTGSLIFAGNRLFYNGTDYVTSDLDPETVDDGNVFHLLLESDGKTPVCEPVIERNQFLGTGLTRACVHISANAGNIGDCVVHDNTLRQAGVGVELNRDDAGVNTIASLSMQGNRNYCATPWSKPGTLALHPIIAGNKGGVCTFETTATPEGSIAAPVGCMAINKSGSTSTTLYVKTSGTGNTGWTAK
jgi:hypothetical protein